MTEKCRKRVLVVDDEELVRSLLAAIFRVMNFESVAVGSAEEALKTFFNNDFDLVLTDLVDSHTDCRNQAAVLLTENGYQPKMVDCPGEALKIIEQESFPLMITELISPEMNGVQLCQRAKKISPQTIVYAHSAHIASFGAERLESDGVDGFFMKPVKNDTLLRAVAGAFGKIAETAALHEEKQHEVQK